MLCLGCACLPTDNCRSTLCDSEKKAYIDAVQCLSKLPPKTPTGLAAGVKNRYDDLVSVHINQTFSIHGTGYIPSISSH